MFHETHLISFFILSEKLQELDENFNLISLNYYFYYFFYCKKKFTFATKTRVEHKI